MQEYLDSLQQAISGPGEFRFFVQPMTAILLGSRDGDRDAKNGTFPFVYALIVCKEKRMDKLMSALETILMPGCDIYFYVLKVFHSLSSAFTGAMLIGIPYILAFSIGNRIATLSLMK